MIAVRRILPLVPYRDGRCHNCNKPFLPKAQKLYRQKKEFATVYTCPICGQVHYVDKEKDCIVTTAKEYRYLRNRKRK